MARRVIEQAERTHAERTKDLPRAAASGAFTLDEVKALVQVLEGTDVRSLVWDRSGHKISIRRGQAAPVAQVVHHAPPAPVVPLSAVAPLAAAVAPAIAAPVPAAAPAKASEKAGHVITAPLVGTFYRSPSPDTAPFVEVGSTVKKGQVVCIVEAMKLMNEIESDVDGRVTEILVQNATPVEFGQPLFRIATA
jgi:acetyl-CoA carboxylase biotin carboxyl carrier protein